MTIISLILNLPWTLIGIFLSIFSIPTRISVNKNPLALIFHVKSFWYLTWLPFYRGVRGMAMGNIVLLGPTADEKDIQHELIHARQFMKEPFIHPFLYNFQTLRHGYRNNKYEVEAYSQAKNTYVE
jgi:hypothetical protein